MSNSKQVKMSLDYRYNFEADIIGFFNSPFQMGSNQQASQKGMTAYGLGRQIINWAAHHFLVKISLFQKLIIKKAFRHNQASVSSKLARSFSNDFFTLPRAKAAMAVIFSNARLQYRRDRTRSKSR